MISGTLSEWETLKSYLPEVFSRAFAYMRRMAATSKPDVTKLKVRHFT